MQCGEAKRGKCLDTSHSKTTEIIKKISSLADALMSIELVDEKSFWPSLSLSSAEVISSEQIVAKADFLRSMQPLPNEIF